jgi:hypothetical protein
MDATKVLLTPCILWRVRSRFFLATFVSNKSCNGAKVVEEIAQMTNFVFVGGGVGYRGMP